MDKNLIGMGLFVAYALIPFFAAIAFFIWNIRRKGERPPVKFVLRRGPGETIRRKLAEDDENLLGKLVFAAAVPIFVTLGILLVLPKMGKAFAWPTLILAALVLIAGMVFSAAWAHRYFQERRNYVLGYIGERAVAEKLEELLRKGYRVFHDVPAEKGLRGFNLDHVVVGPTGLFAIETKTRRKGRARPGFDDHKVIYDGRQLIWPWGEDTFGLQQAINEADWLTKWVHQMTGLQITAKPILALPGWWVETRALGPVSVQNHKNLASNILGKSVKVLSKDQIALIERQLDARCRDVED